jgi:hypothetical protein
MGQGWVWVPGGEEDLSTQHAPAPRLPPPQPLAPSHVDVCVPQHGGREEAAARQRFREALRGPAARQHLGALRDCVGAVRRHLVQCCKGGEGVGLRGARAGRGMRVEGKGVSGGPQGLWGGRNRPPGVVGWEDQAPRGCGKNCGWPQGLGGQPLVAEGAKEQLAPDRRQSPAALMRRAEGRGLCGRPQPPTPPPRSRRLSPTCWVDEGPVRGVGREAVTDFEARNDGRHALRELIVHLGGEQGRRGGRAWTGLDWTGPCFRLEVCPA